jgi:hypothetical protein
MSISWQVAGKMDIGFDRRPDNTIVIRIGGDWNVADGLTKGFGPGYCKTIGLKKPGGC